MQVDILKKLNKEGLIPGPQEKDEDFYSRVERSQLIVNENSLTEDDWKNAHLKTALLYDIRPDWISSYYSNKNLPPWQAAATWFENDLPLIQLKNGLKKGSYLGLYQREEILAHEAVHAARTTFNEPKFEEIFAYRTSKNFLRKFLGPLFQSSWESTFFVCLLFFSFLLDAVHIFYTIHPIVMLLWYLPLGALCVWLLRLMKNQWRFRKCKKNLSLLTEHPLYVMFRLTDSEITQFSHMQDHEILAYIDTKKESSLRWKIITLSYF